MKSNYYNYIDKIWNQSEHAYGSYKIFRASIIHMYMYLVEITKLFKQIIIHYINKLRYADRFYH